jgi:hypothetical protein
LLEKDDTKAAVAVRFLGGEMADTPMVDRLRSVSRDVFIVIYVYSVLFREMVLC